MSVDVDVRITLSDNQRRLAFEIDSPVLDLYRSPVGDVTLVRSPTEVMNSEFAALDEMTRQQHTDLSPEKREHVLDRLAGVGQRLYRDMLPDGAKAIYRRLRRIASPEPLTVRITSDEPYIPWELVKPYASGGEGEPFDDPFLCEQFYLTRWLARSVTPPQRLVADSMSLIVPTSNLPNAAREGTSIAQLATQAGLNVSSFLTDVHEVRAAVAAAQAQIVHFACHGDFVAENPDASAVILAGGQLRAADIVGRLETGITTARPLVVLNACHTGRQGFALTGLGGWAERLVGARVSSFVGSQWTCDDSLASDFAIALFTGLLAEKPLGQAVFEARRVVRELDPLSPTWLAYAVYGHPSMQIRTPTSRGLAVHASVTPTVSSAVFIVGPPVHEPTRFFGRRRELKRLTDLLRARPQQNAAVIGPKRSGKTSLLRCLAALNTRSVDELRDDQLPLRLPEASRFRWVHVDFQDSRVASPSGFGRYVLQSLGFPVPEPCNMDGFLTVMNASVIAPTVVAMDEVGVALQRHKKLDIDFWDGLRSLSSGVAGPNLSFLLALHEQPYTLAQHNASAGSPFFNLLGYTAELGPLTEDEARQLVNSSPVPVTDDELTWILEASGRWPIILQTLCRERLAALSEGATGSDWHREAQRQAERWSYLLVSSRANGPADD